MKTKFLLSALLLCSFFSCDSYKDGGETITVRDYVGCYAKIKDIRAYAGTGMDIMLFEGEVLQFYFRKSDEFQQLRETYGDTGYKAKINRDDPEITFIAHDFQRVQVVSDADYDELHPAGTPLNDLTRFLALSAYPYIQNGYRDYDWDNSEKLSFFSNHFYTIKPSEYKNRYKSQLYPIDKMVSELTPDDLKLLGRGYVSRVGVDLETGNSDPLAVILFMAPPALDKTHTFTVTMENKNDRTFSSTVTMTFD